MRLGRTVWLLSAMLWLFEGSEGISFIWCFSYLDKSLFFFMLRLSD